MTGTVEDAGAAFAERMQGSALGMMDILSVYMGDRLGLYRALEQGPADATEVARRAGIHARYAREWLEQQAASGIVDALDPSADAEARRYSLPAGHARALTEVDSLISTTPSARQLVACAAVMPLLLEAYRGGRGVPWEAYGRDMIEAQGESNRPWLLRSFAEEHLRGIADVDARLTAHPPARVADVACGAGWASIAVARAYPSATVLGLDLDPYSIEIARGNAQEAGVADRVRFEIRDAADPAVEGGFDLVLMVEALHDLARPVRALAAMRAMLSPDGIALVVDERAPDDFTAPASAVDRLHYGYSILCCLPAAMTEPDSAATGTVMRPATLDAYARAAGFAGVEPLDDIELESLRFYRLRAPRPSVRSDRMTA